MTIKLQGIEKAKGWRTKDTNRFPSRYQTWSFSSPPDWTTFFWLSVDSFFLSWCYPKFFKLRRDDEVGMITKSNLPEPINVIFAPQSIISGPSKQCSLGSRGGGYNNNSRRVTSSITILRRKARGWFCYTNIWELAPYLPRFVFVAAYVTICVVNLSMQIHHHLFSIVLSLYFLFNSILWEMENKVD